MPKFLCFIVVLGQADVLLSTPSKNFIFPTDQPIWEEAHAPTIPSSTEGSTSAVTTPEPYVSNDATSQPAPDRSDSTTVAPTTPATPQPTDVETAPSTTQSTNTTTQSTNTTTAPSTTQSTNSTTQSTNTSTALPTTLPTNATTASPPAPTTPPMPEVGDYVVRAEQNASACLMAKMGLQFSYRMVCAYKVLLSGGFFFIIYFFDYGIFILKYHFIVSIQGDSFQTINLNPNVTKTNGTCGDNGSDSALTLISDEINVQFVFTNVSIMLYETTELDQFTFAHDFVNLPWCPRVHVHITFYLSL